MDDGVLEKIPENTIPEKSVPKSGENRPLNIKRNQEVYDDVDKLSLPFGKEKTLGQEKKEINEYYKKILNELDRVQLIDVIDKLYANKDTAAIQQHPSHDLLAQLCLHHLGYDIDIDSKVGNQTTGAIKTFKQDYNNLFPNNEDKQFNDEELNAGIDQHFFLAVKECFGNGYFKDNTFPTLQEIAESSIGDQIVKKTNQIVNALPPAAKTKYKLGGKKGPFDCSGFVRYVLQKIFPNSKSKIPQSSEVWYNKDGKTQLSLEPQVKNDVPPGSVVVFYDTIKKKPDHVEFVTKYTEGGGKKYLTSIGSAKYTEYGPSGEKYPVGVAERTRDIKRRNEKTGVIYYIIPPERVSEYLVS